MKKACPATIYVAATFHPTIGQCAHHSLSTTDTPELGMIPIRNKGTLAGSHIAKDISKFIQAKTFGFIKLIRRRKAWTSKLVSSTTEPWTPALDLAWLLKHIHTQHKEASPSLLHSPSGYAFPSSALQGVKRRKPSPLDLSMRFPSYTRFIKLVQTQFHSNLVQTKAKRCTHNTIRFLGLRKNNLGNKTNCQDG